MTVTESDIAGGFQRDARAETRHSPRAETRQIAVWCPDWPVVAAATELGLSLQLPLAVFDHGEVFACSTMARVEGVRRGMRRRDASARCPELTVLERNTPSEIRAFEASDRARPPKSGGIVFVGSSSIRLWTTLEQDFARYKVVNRGFGGSQLRNVVDFADRVVIPYAPRLVVLFAGSNDIHAGVPADQLVLDFRTFVARVTGALPSARIAFVSITTSPSRFAEVQTVREVNRRIQEYVATDSKLVFIDVFSRMVDSAGAPRPELYRDDKLHLNEKGYGLWAELIGPYLGPPDSPN